MLHSAPMNTTVVIPLNTNAEQTARLEVLQQTFAEVCNALAPSVQRTRTWNRVALHHMAYRELRQRFPAIGSQMVCNAIYSVSRTCRLLFQSPGSPLHLNRFEGKPLPLLRFNASAPVYFDRHTLSLKPHELSMYTLDGRMRFQLNLEPDVFQRFQTEKLREIVLQRSNRSTAPYELRFVFAAHDGDQDAAELPIEFASPPAIPEYIAIKETT